MGALISQWSAHKGHTATPSTIKYSTFTYHNGSLLYILYAYKMFKEVKYNTFSTSFFAPALASDDLKIRLWQNAHELKTSATDIQVEKIMKFRYLFER